jgi:hypothetical protein
MNLSSSRIEQLINAPERHKIVETLGWQPGIWGVFFIVVACLFVLPAKRPLLSIEWIIAGSSAAIGICLAGYEAWRRRNLMVLIREGDYIAVFRKGRLDMTLAPEEIREVKPGLILMLKIGLPLGACGLAFTLIGIMALMREKAVSSDSLIILSLGIVCWASLAAAAWTRFSCTHLRVPVKGSRWIAEETVLIPNTRLNELFP